MNAASAVTRLALLGWIAASVAVVASSLGPMVIVGVVGIVAGSGCWVTGRRSTGDLIALATALWLSPAWASLDAVPSALRATALAVAIGSLPFLLHALIGRRRGLLGLDLTVGALVVLRLVWFDPFIDRRCNLVCDSSSLAVAATAASEGVVRSLDAWVPVVVAAAGVLLARRGSSRPAVPLAAAGLFAATVARALAIHIEPTDDPTLAGNRAALAVAVGATVAALTVAAWPSVLVLRARRAIAQIVRRLGDGASDIGGVRDALAAATGNPTLQLAYRYDARWIDARGGPAAPPEPGWAEVQIAGETIAAISGLADPAALGPAIQLGLANERLRAGVLAEIADLRASRERIVETGDTERRVLEKNVHDGAQQGLIALSFDLHRARWRAHGSEAVRIDHAIVEAERALAELRQIAHGIFPSLLVEAGLETALNALADASDVPILVACAVPRRPEPAAELAAYRVVAEAVERGVAVGDMRALEISVTLDDDLHVQVIHGSVETGVSDDDGLADAADRVTALGGTITVRDLVPSGRVLEAVIPCAS